MHGFGAFGEQWRGQIKALTAAGYQVTSIPQLGPSVLARLAMRCRAVELLCRAVELHCYDTAESGVML